MNNLDMKSMIIGILFCTCIFLLMGQNHNHIPIENGLHGRFHGFGVYSANSHKTKRYLVDTATGVLYDLVSYQNSYRWNKLTQNNPFNK